MSDFTDAFDELFESQTEAVGSTLQATIGGTTVNVVVEASPFDSILRDGTTAEAEKYTLLALASGFGSKPAKFAAVTFTTAAGNAVSLAVLAVTDNHGIYHIEVGDPNAEE